LLEIPVASFDLYVTSGKIAGKSLQQIADTVEEARGVLLRGITRGGLALPVGTEIVVERGDTLPGTGSESAVEKLGPVVGRILRPSEESDLGTVGLTILIGILIGAAVNIPIGHIKLNLGTSVGTLIAGASVGWMRSMKPWFARMPDAAILFMRSFGLAAFVAMVGLKAGPIFLNALRQSGYVLFFGGVVVTIAPLLSGMFFGRYVLRLNPVLLLGGIAGAITVTAAAAALQEKSDSAVPMLGYSYKVPIGHILLTSWGTVIVAFLS
jgi:putative transport protein